LEELREQLQYMKKQTLIMMDKSRKSSEKEKVALQQAQEAIAAKETAVTEAAQATTRENFMLELMTEASLDMTGMLCKRSHAVSCSYCLDSLLMLSLK
jgi:hypothetical protein